MRLSYKSMAENIIAMHLGYNILHDLDYYAWPEKVGVTNSFGFGGYAMTTYTVHAYVYTEKNIAVLFLEGKQKLVENFKPLMSFFENEQKEI